ncbi:MAG: hypothetical protein KDK08_01310, partial [Rhizobiaceae bacterium]|nr:hypothetical protein [Rhizobiaceae bacterium]
INARALRDFGDDIAAGKLSLNEAIRKVTEPTFDQYQKDVTALGCLPPTHQPRATEFVLPRADGRPNMKDMIQTLIDRDHAYVTSGREGREVLFSVSSMPDYGALSRRRLEDQQAGARVAVDAHKRNPEDFVLWKESGTQEPGWEGQFTPKPTSGYEAEFQVSAQNARELGLNSRTVTIHGRPGWHIECSVMSDALLWDQATVSSEAWKYPHQFDIHGGGLDLIFPHHENEIAQSRCAHGSQAMATYWMHNGFLQVEGRKMSKSEGNFVTIHELLDTEKFGGRKWPGEVLRLAMLMTHYREPIDFSLRRLEEAENILRRFGAIRQAVGDRDSWPRGPESPPTGPADSVLRHLLDDLNTPSAIQTLQAMARVAERGLEGEEYVGRRIISTLELLGIDTADYATSVQVDPAQMVQLGKQIDERLAFIADKNWAEADRIRDELLAQGIQLKDGKDPETGKRITTWELKR